MEALKILYLATADARGHLMRAQLLVHGLRANGAEVRVITTSDAGVLFFAEFGIEAALLSRRYAVQFDERQNMRRAATDLTIAGYMFHPARMARDIWRLAGMARTVDLIINDSFHPALLTMGCLPGWRRRIAHVYGATLRTAVESNFDTRLPRPLAALYRRAVAAQIDAARARVEHDFAYTRAGPGPSGCYRLPTPVAIAAPATAAAGSYAAVYLNPHFRDPALAASLERGLAQASLAMHAVGEGFARRPGWRAHDRHWIDRAAACQVMISAPGMAALSIALVYRRPILLIVTDQPEQRSNAEQARRLGLPHRVVAWSGDPGAFSAAVAAACAQLRSAAPPGADGAGASCARARLQAWIGLLMALGRGQPGGEEQWADENEYIGRSSAPGVPPHGAHDEAGAARLVRRPTQRSGAA